ncbi:phosphate ABC transporter substrate-binding protein PstS [Nonomuraea sp. SMC257]|uniref:Phosphate-binding protein n=1 Tax=Nonomuraea montanisoli TaxID=2741721 RepID=A0A7Y6M427_9ACTN|nr:phosphate ABC transporter substrate-binding protein PstS [Nonomuraea montanisoli]NUW32824.1 phosphate ABC transporter substrate-binding protein PstS [Nonomuraea montanisoli]
MAKRTWTAWPRVLTAVTLAVCGSGLSVTAMLPHDDVPRSLPVAASISGSGSTAQKGAMDAWRAEFRRLNPELRVDYRANGSGAGIRDFIAGATAFAGSDVAMRPGEQASADRRCGGRAVHLPMVVGPIALAYNLPSVPDLKLSPTTVTGIFSGRITRWDAPEIAADNRGRRLPYSRIRLFHRSDDSGTTHNFTTYLKAAGGWPNEPARKWTGAGRGVAGSAGITEAIRQARDSIGYVEYGFASDVWLRTAAVRNASGQFVALSPQSATRALEGARVVDENGGPVVKIDYLTKAKGAYPIILVTYEITCSNEPDSLVRTFLRYTASGAGQSYLSLYGYAPLPPDLLARVRAQLGVTG